MNGESNDVSQREEMHKIETAGTVRLYERHIFLCYKTHESWPSWFEEWKSDPIPQVFAVASFERGSLINGKARLTICERNSDAQLGDGDVMVFPEMDLYRSLKQKDIKSFVDDVMVEGKTWSSGVPEKLNGSYVFVCAHSNRNPKCGACGSVLVKKFQEVIESMDLKNVVFVTACSHIGGHTNSGGFAGNVIIFHANPEGEVTGNWYGYVTPDDVFDLVEKQIIKGKTVDRLWRGQMGVAPACKTQVQRPAKKRNSFWVGFSVLGTVAAAAAAMAAGYRYYRQTR